MPAPLVIPMAENMSSFTSFAEKANQVSENKCKLVVGAIESKQNETLVKMTKEMNELKYELTKMKPAAKRSVKRDSVKEPGRNSPLAKVTKTSNSECCGVESVENLENIEPKRRSAPGSSQAERAEKDRLTNLHRRYSCQLGEETSLLVKKGVSKKSATHKR